MKRILLFLILLSGQIIAQGGNIEQIKSVVNTWSDAHNNQDIKAFEKLYSSRVLFYCKEQDKEFCIKTKN